MSGLSGERGRNRTFNLLIKSQLLCQLSYAPWEEFAVGGLRTGLTVSNRGPATCGTFILSHARSNPQPHRARDAIAPGAIQLRAATPSAAQEIPRTSGAPELFISVVADRERACRLSHWRVGASALSLPPASAELSRACQ